MDYIRSPADAGNTEAETFSPWTTRVDPVRTRPFGVEELHNVYFEPDGWPGKGDVVALLIPECELHVTWVAADGVPVPIVFRPGKDRSVGYWIRQVCKNATADRAFVIFSCDTAEQAQRAAKRAAKLLPNHRRMSLERMFGAASRSRGKLS